MNSTIIILGLAALSFTTANAANEFKSQDLDQQELATINVDSNQQSIQLVMADSTIENASADSAIFNPNSVIKTNYVKTVEEVINENKLITESQEETVKPISIDTTNEDRIALDNQIIESTISNEVYPLDFEKINHTAKSVRIYNDSAITVDLKL